MPTINIYDDDNKSGLGKEIISEIEVDFDYEYHQGYPDSYMEPGMPDEVDILEIQPVSIAISPIEIPESKDSVLFIQLVNIFVEANHKSANIIFQALDEERKSKLTDFCRDYEKEMVKAAFEHARDLSYDYEDED